jgi:uncharacterized protein (TIGR03437 family)
VVYETQANLRALELATGRQAPLGRGFRPSISNDGTLVLYLADGQAWLIRPDGTGRRQLARIEEGVDEAVLAGYGRIAIAVTRTGRMVRVNTDTGAIEELIPETPVCYFAFAALTPGSALPVRAGNTFAPHASRVRVEGRTMPLISAGPKEIWFQVPFDLPISPRVSVELEHSSVFDTCAAPRVVTRRTPYFFTDGPLTLAHEDFSGLVTRQSPARPGEIVHAWAVGLGAVTPEMQTGIPTPAAPLFRLADPFDCRLGYPQGSPAVDVLFAGLAPGMIGIYKVSIRLPESMPPGTASLSCGTTENERERHGGWFYTP